MSLAHPGAPAILVSAIALGVAGDLLLRETPWGVNVSAWLAALALAAALLPRLRRWSLGPPRGTGWLLLSLALSFLFAWRASPVLQALNTVGVLFALSMVAFRSAPGLRRAGIVDYGTNLAISSIESLAGAAVLGCRRMDWRPFGRREHARRLRATGVGLAVAVPLSLVFGGLFASADSHFSSLVEASVPLTPGEVFSHIGLSVLFTWLAGSYLWSALLTERPASLGVSRAPWLKLEGIETGLIFGALNALFLAFVAVQFRYLFGGAGHVTSSATLTYATYARHGFFELLAVAALILPVLLLGHWLLPRERPRLHRAFSFLAAGLVLLVFVIMASALERMRLYQEAFGLTEQRFYATASMAWLLLVLLWFTWTVLRGRREYFATGAVTSAVVVLAVLNVLNPDGVIVSRNAAAERPFDTDYALALGPDAVPALLEVLDDKPDKERCDALAALGQRRAGWANDWRSWNWSRSRAGAALDDARPCP